MYEWHAMGYFPADLLVKRASDLHFLPLAKLVDSVLTNSSHLVSMPLFCFAPLHPVVGLLHAVG